MGDRVKTASKALITLKEGKTNVLMQADRIFFPTGPSILPKGFLFDLNLNMTPRLLNEGTIFFLIAFLSSLKFILQ